MLKFNEQIQEFVTNNKNISLQLQEVTFTDSKNPLRNKNTNIVTRCNLVCNNEIVLHADIHPQDLMNMNTELDLLGIFIEIAFQNELQKHINEVINEDGILHDTFYIDTKKDNKNSIRANFEHNLGTIRQMNSLLNMDLCINARNKDTKIMMVEIIKE